jgi:peptidyl-tRNA hydrolase
MISTLDLGKLRLRDKGSDGGHNGLKDVQEKFGHSNYVRLRMGIGKDFHPGQQVNYVLGRWKKEEQPDVDIMIEKASRAVKNFVINRSQAHYGRPQLMIARSFNKGMFKICLPESNGKTFNLL